MRQGRQLRHPRPIPLPQTPVHERPNETRRHTERAVWHGSMFTMPATPHKGKRSGAFAGCRDAAAVVLFVLGAIGFERGKVSLVAAGLAAFAFPFNWDAPAEV
jgi:hypothetical protein